MSVFIVLGLIWAAVLVPPALRMRAERRAEFIDSFRVQMGALGSKAMAEHEAREEVAARRRPRMTPAKRRRDIVGGLLGALIGSLILGAIPSLRMVWILHLFLLNSFLGYLALLAHSRRHLAPVRPPRGERVARAERVDAVERAAFAPSPSR